VWRQVGLEDEMPPDETHDDPHSDELDRFLDQAHDAAHVALEPGAGTARVTHGQQMSSVQAAEPAIGGSQKTDLKHPNCRLDGVTSPGNSACSSAGSGGKPDAPESS
jgi:hypothetical protein